MVVTHITRNMTEMGDVQYTNSQWVLWSTLVPLRRKNRVIGVIGVILTSGLLLVCYYNYINMLLM